MVKQLRAEVQPFKDMQKEKEQEVNSSKQLQQVGPEWSGEEATSGYI